jgi:hypothetical protein
MSRRAQSPKCKRRIRFNWKTALVYGPINALLLAFLVGFLAVLAIRQPSAWHWIVALVITGMAIEIARAKLWAR